MLSHDSQAELAGRLRVMQIIVLSLMVGPIFFLCFALYRRSQMNPQPMASTPLMTYCAVGFSAFAVVARIVVPNLIANSARRKIATGDWEPADGRGDVQSREFLAKTGDAGRLCMVYQTRLIIGAALLEGSAFFTITSYMIEGEVISLVVAVLLILGVALSFPTSSGLDHWIDEQLRLLKDDPQRGGGHDRLA